MSEDNNEQKPDPNTELLARTEKLAQDNERLSKQLEQVLNTMTAAASRPTQVQVTEEEDLEVLAYKDPKRYAQKVSENATRQAEALINSKLNAQNQTNAILGQLTNDYPELSNPNSELTKKAIEIYNGMSQSEKSSPTSYKVAVRDAAAEVGLLPKSKRKSSNDDFSMSGGSSGRSSGESSRKEELSESTLAFAEALGLNIKDKKVVERLKQRSERKDWGRYK